MRLAWFQNCLALLQRFRRDQWGNVAMIFGVAAIPLAVSIGMGVDYTSAGRRRALLNAIADSAVLSAITPSMMNQSTTNAVNAATNMFNAQASSVPGLTYSPSNLSVSVNTSGLTRTVQVAYTAQSQNAFGGLLGQSTFTISGQSQGTATAAPNIDFYLLLDTSPSMAIAATTSGINTMVANTQSQGGCAFGCHESHPSSDNLGNPGGIDNYQLARNLGVTLRIDLVQQAAQNLMTTAQQTAQANNNVYRMAIYTFDETFHTIATLTSNLSTAKTLAGNIQLLEVYANNWLTSSNNNSDTDTDYDTAMSSINSIMPNPGTGTNNTGDTPQEVMFFVTDGVEDEMVNGHRQQSLMSNSWCTQIKNRGIRIAVLYTEYLPLPTNSWYNTYIAPFQAQIGPNLQNCASPGLYFKVTTNDDISAAMQALFLKAVSTAHLTK